MTLVIPVYVLYAAYMAGEESYALWSRRHTMTGQFLEVREQALTLLKIEREQIIEDCKRQKKSSARKRSHAAMVRPLLISDRSCSSRADKCLLQ